MHQKSRLTIAVIIGFYGLTVMASFNFSALGLQALAFGNLSALSPYVFSAAALAGYVAAPLFGHYSAGGLAISFFGGLVSTCMAVCLAVLLISGPGVIDTAIATGDFVAAFKAVLVGMVLSVLAVVEGIYQNVPVLIIWIAGLVASHAAARLIRRKTDLRPFDA